MKIIYNKLIPFKGFLAINLFGILFVRKEKDGSNPVISEYTINHESIHTKQIKELGYIFFYIWYFIEWIINWLRCGDSMMAYYAISFEMEAYENQYNQEYLSTRKKYSWLKYYKNNNQ